MTACRAPASRTATAGTFTVDAGVLPDGPDPSLERLPIPALDGPWHPPSSVAGDIRALGDALRSARRIHVQLGPRQGGAVWRARVPALLASLGFAGELAFLDGAPLSETLEGRMPMPMRSIATGPMPTGAVTVAPDWRARMSAGADVGTVVLAIDDAALDEGAWRALPAAAIGGCAAPMQALAVGQEQGLALLEPFLDHVDRVLAQVWRAELRALLPRLRDGLDAHAEPRPRKDFDDPSAWRKHECGHAIWQYTEPYHRCASGTAPCGMVPRALLMGGLRIGAPEPAVFVPEGCDRVLGRDVVGQLRGFGEDAARAAAVRLDPRWVVLADRLGAITEVHAALEDVCTPRRRRFAAADLEDARQRLAAVGRALGSDEPPRAGSWSFEGGSFHVPGTGPVREHGRFDAGPGSAARIAKDGARGLREFVLARAVCRSATPTLPLAVLAYEPATATVRHFGYFYEEELSCGAAGPGGVD